MHWVIIGSGYDFGLFGMKTIPQTNDDYLSKGHFETHLR